MVLIGDEKEDRRLRVPTKAARLALPLEPMPI